MAVDEGHQMMRVIMSLRKKNFLTIKCNDPETEIEVDNADTRLTNGHVMDLYR